MQDSAWRRHIQQHLSIVEGAMGSVPDWRRTAFWSNSRFMQAWRKAKELPESQEAAAERRRHEMCDELPASMDMHLHA